jgi:hypothetical protein
MPTGDNWGTSVGAPPNPRDRKPGRGSGGTGRWWRLRHHRRWAWLRRSLAGIAIVAVAIIVVGALHSGRNQSSHATAQTPAPSAAPAATTKPPVTTAPPVTTPTPASAPWAGLTPGDQQTCHEAYDAVHSVGSFSIISVITYNNEFYTAVSALIHDLKYDYGHVPQSAGQVAAQCGPYYSK